MPIEKYVLYRAVTSEGRDVTDFELAATNTEVLSQLHARGYSNIRLLQDAALIPVRDDLKNLATKKRRRIASRELSAMLNANSGFWMPALSDQYSLLITLTLVFTISIYFEQIWLTILTLLIVFALFSFLFTTSKHLKNYNLALRSFAAGNITTFLKCRESLSKLNDTGISADLTAKAAYLLVGQGRSAKALQYMNQLQSYHYGVFPGMHENRLALIYYAMEETDTYRQLSEQSYRLSDWNDSFGLDYALALVRTGRLREAGRVLKGLQTERLPEFARPFYYWVLGSIQSSLNPEKASLNFGKALRAFEQMNRDVVLTSLAACTSDYLAHIRPESAEGASLFNAVEPVLKVHEQPARIAWLEKHYGSADCSSGSK